MAAFLYEFIQDCIKPTWVQDIQVTHQPGTFFWKKNEQFCDEYIRQYWPLGSVGIMGNKFWLGLQTTNIHEGWSDNSTDLSKKKYRNTQLKSTCVSRVHIFVASLTLEYLNHSKPLPVIAKPLLSGASTMSLCKKVWHFFYTKPKLELHSER